MWMSHTHIWMSRTHTHHLRVALVGKGCGRVCLFNRALLQNRPMFLRSLLMVATPRVCVWAVSVCVRVCCVRSSGRSHDTVMSRMNESHTHIWMSHVKHMNEPCHRYEGVMSHIRMSHITHTNESHYTYEWVLSHIWMSNVTHMNESRHTYEWVARTHTSWGWL